MGAIGGSSTKRGAASNNGADGMEEEYGELASLPEDQPSFRSQKAWGQMVGETIRRHHMAMTKLKKEMIGSRPVNALSSPWTRV